MKTIQEVIAEVIKNGKPMTRHDRAVSNYQIITGKRAPDDIHESWADRA